MPEIPKFPDFGKELDIRDRSHGLWANSEVFATVAQKYGVEVLGQGVNSVVYSVDNERVFAFNTGSYLTKVYGAQLDFYYQKVLHILYPEYFPEIYWSSKTLKNQDGFVTYGGTLRERVHTNKQRQDEFRATVTKGDKHTQVVGNKTEVVTFNGWAVSTFVPRQIVDAMLEWGKNGIPLLLDFGKEQHFRFDQQGKARYLDLPHVPKGQQIAWNIDKIEAFMIEKGYESKDINRVEKLVSRIIHLEERRDLIRSLAIDFCQMDDRTVQVIVAGDFDQWLQDYCQNSHSIYYPMSEGDKKYILMQTELNRMLYSLPVSRSLIW